MGHVPSDRAIASPVPGTATATVAAMAERVEADVCIVGAGYAGLTAARRLAQGGQTVVVLEARDRVGGRIWTQERDERRDRRPWRRVAGAQARRRPRAGGRDGRDHLQDLRGRQAPARRRRPHPHVQGPHPEDQPAGRRHHRPGAVEDRPAVEAGARSRRRGPRPRPPSGTPRSVGEYLETTGIRTEIARDLFEMAIRGLHTGDLYDVSLLNLLMLVRGHHSLETLFSIEKRRAGEPRGRRRRLDGAADGGRARSTPSTSAAPVRSITQQHDNVVVTPAAIRTT